jgi:tRNA(fMet)-specific endonuclease VapC
MVKNKIALDTNIVIDILNNKLKVATLIKEYPILCLPTAVCGELLFGAENSAKKYENKAKYQQFIEYCQLLNINGLVAEQYAITRKKLKDKGRPIPENDIWIAATCIVNNVPLATHDSDFNHVDDLIVVNLK